MADERAGEKTKEIKKIANLRTFYSLATTLPATLRVRISVRSEIISLLSLTEISFTYLCLTAVMHERAMFVLAKCSFLFCVSTHE